MSRRTARMIAASIFVQFGCFMLAGCAEAPVTELTQSAAQRKPDGYEQLLPRGRISAINDPTFVSSDEAQVGDDTYVLGVVINDEPLAFSLNLLNRHEVVNTAVGDTNFAAVW